ncbi:MAG: YjbH domain-containing protein [Melioribacter sp.]|uniref:YjbH domain-containing protein n=1 Tax=Rosettibacter primus TaxID=3111523 RepID=UPI00247E8811|nr:YjbH domain-containing protein [Melioribacter sp.]
MRQLLIRAIILFLLLNLITFGKIKPESKIVDLLTQKGFENVYVRIDSSKLFILFENRIYRYNVEALRKVMNILSEFNEIKMIELIVMQNKVPLISFEYNNEDYQKYQKGIINSEQLEDRITASYYIDKELLKEKFLFKNESDYRFDLVLNPGFRGQFGDYSNPVRAQINFIPEINTTLWKGMNIVTQMLIPIYNEFPGEGDYVRPGIISLNQNFRLPENYFLSSSVGYFTENRYGFDLSIKKIFYNGNLITGVNTGYTGYMSVMNKKIFYSDLYLWTINMNVEYRINKYDLTIGITAGKFLYGDKSIRIDINRQFGEIEIGFFAVRSSNKQSNGGFNFSIPLFPSSYSYPSIIRIRTAESFRWEYRVKGEIPAMIGVVYNTGNSFFRTLKKYNPNFLLKRINN